ncbi:MAG: MerR family transcriptional regulator [Gammaproteobacteria bacterium]
MTVLKQIGTVCEQTGINPVTLRAWERRYGLVQPQRTKKGRRLYTTQDITKIKKIQKLIDEGVPVSQVSPLVETTVPKLHGENNPANTQWNRYIQQLLVAIHQFSEHDLENTFNEAQSIFPIDKVMQELIVPVLLTLGKKWADSGETGSIAEEHFFRVFVRNKIGAMLHHRMHKTTGAPLIAACLPDENHELGLLMFSLAAAENNLRIIMLGADTPIEELTTVASRANSRGIVLSLGYKKIDSDDKKRLKKLTQKLSIPVFIGGTSAYAQKSTIETCGAICLGSDLVDGITRMKVQLKKHKHRL